MTSPYKVEIRNSPNWRKNKAATLGVSVTSPNWQNDKFASILSFAAANFTTIRIDVTDALYKHGFMAEGTSPEQALAQANSLGALWLAKHADVIESCPVKPQIIRWAEWYRHPDYETTLQGFKAAYEVNSALHKAVHDDVMEFYRRRHRIPTEHEYNGSRDYFIEELAVLTLQARELISLKLYPGDELHCTKIVRRGSIREAPTGLEREQYAKIKFETRSPAVPAATVQHFKFG